MHDPNAVSFIAACVSQPTTGQDMYCTCSFPLPQAWGAVNYHNAVILCRETGSTESDEKDVKVSLMRYDTIFPFSPCSYSSPLHPSSLHSYPLHPSPLHPSLLHPSPPAPGEGSLHPPDTQCHEALLILPQRKLQI